MTLADVGGWARGRWLAPEHRRIVLGAAWVAGFVLVGKLAAAGRDVAVAYRYGAGSVVDAYQLAMTFATWLPMTAVSILNAILIPALVRVRRGSVDERRQLLDAAWRAAVVLALVLTIVTPCAAWYGLPLLGGRLRPETRDLARTLAIALTPVAPLTILMGVHAARLMARECHANSLLEGVPAAAIAIVLVLAAADGDWLPLVWGTLAGVALQAVLLRTLATRADPCAATGGPRPMRSPRWRVLLAGAGVLAAGQVVMSCLTPVDQYLAAQLGDSAVATLGYANRLLTFVLGVGAMAVARATLPVFSDLDERDDGARARRVAMHWAALMFAAGTLVAILAWIAAPAAVALLFQRGAFTADDTIKVASLFRWGIGQVPFYFGGLVLVQWLVSTGKYVGIALVATGNCAVKLAVNVALLPALGLAALTAAGVAMYAFAAITLVAFAWRAKR